MNVEKKNRKKEQVIEKKYLEKIFSTCVCAVVSLQLAAFGEGFHAGGAVEDPGLLGAGRRPRLVQLLVLLQAHPESSELRTQHLPVSMRGQTQTTCCCWFVCVCVLSSNLVCRFDLITFSNHGVFFKWLMKVIKICFCDGSAIIQHFSFAITYFLFIISNQGQAHFFLLQNKCKTSSKSKTHSPVIGRIMRPRRLDYEDKVNVWNTVVFTPDSHVRLSELDPPPSILIFFVLEENGGALSPPASCKQPLGSSVLLLGGATAYKCPS